MNDLFVPIERLEFAGQFYLACNTTSLLVWWLSSHPAVRVIEASVPLNPALMDQIAARAVDLVLEQAPGLVRIWGEPALCAYAFILARFRERGSASGTLELMNSYAGQSHGALRSLSNRLLDDVTGLHFDLNASCLTHIEPMETLTPFSNYGPRRAVNSTEWESRDLEKRGG